MPSPTTSVINPTRIHPHVMSTGPPLSMAMPYAVRQPDRIEMMVNDTAKFENPLILRRSSWAYPSSWSFLVSASCWFAAAPASIDMTTPIVMRRRRTPDAEPVALERRNVVLPTRTEARSRGAQRQRADEAPVVDSLIWTRPVQRSGVKDSGLGRDPSNETGWRRRDLQRQRSNRCEHQRRVRCPVHAGDVDVELDLVAVGVEDVQAVGDGVVAGAHDRGAGLLHGSQRVAQLVVGVAHLEAEVVEADVAALGLWLGVVTDLDEQQLVMRPVRGGRERGGGEADLVVRRQLP